MNRYPTYQTRGWPLGPPLQRPPARRMTALRRRYATLAAALRVRILRTPAPSTQQEDVCIAQPCTS